ncbi:Yippee-like protein [Corchorus olitorius]|uniref:Yippee-like protein n=1 Tax=Corchorus olitorius TaxID=93759 RepID=A0A1R3H2Z4_9ROSI|nr:Yippee-like protein [Corchorus olitorius]
MGRLFIETLSGPRIFKCKFCKVDSASYDDIVSKEFQGRFGRAYLFRNARRLTKRAKSSKKECSFLKRNGCRRRVGDAPSVEQGRPGNGNNKKKII